MKKSFLFFAMLSFVLSSKSQNQISSVFWGQNYWYTKMNDPTFSNNQDLDSWTEVQESGVKLIRVGGHGYNRDDIFSTLARPLDGSNVYSQGYINIVDNIRKHGCEPMITVPFDPRDTVTGHDTSYYVQKAADIVRTLNVVHKRNVKYFIIANEPGVDYDSVASWHPNSAPQTYAQQVASYFLPMAKAMKNIDPEIIIVGPELETYSNILNSYLISTNTLTGGIAGTIPANQGNGAGKYYLDVFSFHSYQSGDSLRLRSRIYKNPTDTYEAHINEIRSHFTAAGRSTNDLGIALTEFNIMGGRAGAPHNSTLTSADINGTVSGVNQLNTPNSFIAGQWFAETMCVGIKNEVSFMNWWSIKETGANNDYLGFLHGTTGEKKPVYHHYKLLSQYFQGTFYPNLNNGDTTKMHDGVKAFASQNANSIAVLLINETTTARSYNITFDSTAPGAGDERIKFDFNGYHPSTVTTGTTGYATLGAESTMLLLFDCSNHITDRYVLSRQTMADSAGTGSYTPAHTSVTTSPSALSLSVTPGQSSPRCFGDHTTSASISGTASSYSWNTVPAGIGPLSTGSTASNLLPGSYQVDVSGGCGASHLAFTVNEKSPLINTISTGNCTDSIYVSTNITDPGYTYDWSPGIKFIDSTASGTTLSSPSGPETYTLTVTDGSSGCSVSESISVSGPSSYSAFIGDSPEDVGNEPNTETAAALNNMFWLSSDVWNRNHPDGLPTHQQPTTTDTTNTLYVKITNNGCAAITDGKLKLYYSKASTGLVWDTNWNNFQCSSSSAACTDTTLLCGDLIADLDSISIPAGSSVLQAVHWTPPNPNDYVCMPFADSADLGHFCVLAHFDSANDSLEHASNPLTGSVNWNAYKNNNVAWKNMEILALHGPMMRPAGNTLIRNVSKDNFVKLEYHARDDQYGETILDNARTRLWFSPHFIQSWKDGGKQGDGIILVNDSVVQLTKPDAYMDHIFMQYMETQAVGVQLNPTKLPVGTEGEFYNLDLVQFAPDVSTTIPVGGERYMIPKYAWTVNNCINAAHELKNGDFSGRYSYSKDTVVVNGNIDIQSGDTITFDKMVVLMPATKKITVHSGGKLIITNSEFFSDCIGEKWKGIYLEGGSPQKEQLFIAGSFFNGADSVLHVSQNTNTIIKTSGFLGNGGSTAIYMTHMKDFSVTDNMILNFDNALATKLCDTAAVNSIIERNIFADVTLGFLSQEDQHERLLVDCNRFKYSDQGISSASSYFGDQGDSTTGAGNEFITSSGATYYVWDNDGDNFNYFTDPLNDVSSAMHHVTTIEAAADRSCYTYSFDTSSAHRFVPFTVQSTKPKKNTDPATFNVIPNPNAGIASIYYSLGEAKTAGLTIMNTYGKVLYSYKLEQTNDKQDIDCTGLADGVYFLSLIRDTGERTVRKMVIAR